MQSLGSLGPVTRQTTTLARLNLQQPQTSPTSLTQPAALAAIATSPGRSSQPNSQSSLKVPQPPGSVQMQHRQINLPTRASAPKTQTQVPGKAAAPTPARFQSTGISATTLTTTKTQAYARQLQDQKQMQSWAETQARRQPSVSSKVPPGVASAKATARPSERAAATRRPVLATAQVETTVAEVATLVQPAGTNGPSAQETQPPAEDSELRVGASVKIDGQRFDIVSPLGMGSYGMVWNAACAGGDEVAIKEILCRSQPELTNAQYEGDLLLALGRGERSDPRIPALAAQETERMADQEWRVRLAMARIPGEPLMLLLEQSRCQQAARGVVDSPDQRQATMGLISESKKLTYELVVQLAPTLERISGLAYHRDINPRNILIDSAPSGPPQYGLVDFGMAVDAAGWAQEQGGAWRTLEVGGDCRYWPVSAWVMFLHGPRALPAGSYLSAEYRTLLDLHALGITALQVLIETAPLLSETSVGFLEKFKVLQGIWAKYWENATDFWSCLIDCFSNGGDWDKLKQACIDHGVKGVVSQDLTALRAALAAAAKACEDDGAGDLRGVLNAIRVMISAGDADSPPSWDHVYMAMGVERAAMNR